MRALGMDLTITVGETGMAAVAVGNTTSQSTAIAAGAPTARRARRAMASIAVRIVTRGGRMVNVAGLRRTEGDVMRGTGVAGMRVTMNGVGTDVIGITMRGGGTTNGGMKSEQGTTGGRIEAFVFQPLV